MLPRRPTRSFSCRAVARWRRRPWPRPSPCSMRAARGERGFKAPVEASNAAGIALSLLCCRCACPLPPHPPFPTRAPPTFRVPVQGSRQRFRCGLPRSCSAAWPAPSATRSPRPSSRLSASPATLPATSRVAGRTSPRGCYPPEPRRRGQRQRWQRRCRGRCQPGGLRCVTSTARRTHQCSRTSRRGGPPRCRAVAQKGREVGRRGTDRP